MFQEGLCSKEDFVLARSDYVPNNTLCLIRID